MNFFFPPPTQLFRTGPATGAKRGKWDALNPRRNSTMLAPSCRPPQQPARGCCSGEWAFEVRLKFYAGKVGKRGFDLDLNAGHYAAMKRWKEFISSLLSVRVIFSMGMKFSKLWHYVLIWAILTFVEIHFFYIEFFFYSMFKEITKSTIQHRNFAFYSGIPNNSPKFGTV